ncbi:unnamed protein product [Phytophthora lilii]|uniref:Unnamed protein product n=1 Tax=Phytophthora lilii TaxID=2077276 RepID=A0A9W6TIF3_9STRA|nr:unnamed protein product [Phytophthora lilii]
MKLIERQRWQMALSFAGNDRSLQLLLYDHLLTAGEIQWASRLAQLLDIPDFEAQVAEMIEQRSSLRAHGLSHSATAASLNGCLTLELESEAISFCDTEDSLRCAMKHICSDTPSDFANTSGSSNDSSYTSFRAHQIIGLDVEWKPTSSKIATSTGTTTTTAMASILQISSSSRVFVIDLLALHVR